MATYALNYGRPTTYKIVGVGQSYILAAIGFEKPMSYGSWLENASFHAMTREEKLNGYVPLERTLNNLIDQTGSLIDVFDNMRRKLELLDKRIHRHFWFTPNDYILHVQPHIDTIPKVSAEDCMIEGRLEDNEELGIPISHFSMDHDLSYADFYYDWANQTLDF